MSYYKSSLLQAFYKEDYFSKVFEVHTDASDYAIGGVLEQEGHPVAFESRKLNEAERRYTVQEREMTAVVHCLRTWRHYLLGARFVVKTDNVATSYFLSQKKLSPKQARWEDFLAEFDFVLEYKHGRQNVVADALSRKGGLVEEEELQQRVVAFMKIHEDMQAGLCIGCGNAPAQGVGNQVRLATLTSISDEASFVSGGGSTSGDMGDVTSRCTDGNALGELSTGTNNNSVQGYYFPGEYPLSGTTTCWV